MTAISTLLLALATVALAIATSVLARAAWQQLPLLKGQLKVLSDQIKASQEASKEQADMQIEMRKEEEKRHIEANTLRICQVYFSNPVISGATSRFYAAMENGTNYDKAKLSDVKHDLITVLNYLNGIGEGVKEGIFSEAIVKDHMPNTICRVVDKIIPALVDAPDDFQALIDLRHGWKTTNSNYRSGQTGKPRQIY